MLLKKFSKAMEGSHLIRRQTQNLIAQCFLHQPNKPKVQRYLQEALLLSARNPKKESKEDEEKWRMSG